MRASLKGIFPTIILAVAMTLSMPSMASAKDSSRAGSRTTTSTKSKTKSDSPSKTSSTKSSSPSKKSSGNASSSSSSSSSSSKKTVGKKSDSSSSSTKRTANSSTPAANTSATKVDGPKSDNRTATATATSSSSRDRASGKKAGTDSSDKKTGNDNKTGNDKKTGNSNDGKRTGNQQGSVKPNSGASNWPGNDRPSASGGRNNRSDRTGSRVGSGSGSRHSSGGGSRRVNNGVKHDWSVPSPPPARAYRPSGRYIHHPVLRVGYHPRVGCPIIGSILGVTFGTMYVATLDYLLSKEYEIDGYDGSTIYLRNVREMGFTWPDATMYYDEAGQLTAAQFIYSTSFDSTTRYTRLYSDLCETYGDPMEVVEDGALIVCTWYGSDETGYVTLEYDFTDNRYYTILSYGI